MRSVPSNVHEGRTSESLYSDSHGFTDQFESAQGSNRSVGHGDQWRFRTKKKRAQRPISLPKQSSFPSASTKPNRYGRSLANGMPLVSDSSRQWVLHVLAHRLRNSIEARLASIILTLIGRPCADVAQNTRTTIVTAAQYSSGFDLQISIEIRL